MTVEAAASRTVLARVRSRHWSLQEMQLWACNAVIVAYFFSFWMYKTWYLATAGAIVLTAFLTVLGTVRLRGLLWDTWPVILYFAYLLAASFQSEYAIQARYWTIVDSIGILIFVLFWIAARNSDPNAIQMGFVLLSFAAAAVAVLLYRTNPELSRVGGYGLPFYPIAIPFLWAGIIAGKHRWLALFALTIVLANLALSRSRTPLAAGLIVLGVSFLFIGRSVRQRIKLGLLLTIVFAIVGGALMSFKTTRFALLTFVARITHEDIVTSEFYIPGEAYDPTRSNLDEIVEKGFVEAQPFGIGYNTVGYHYEQMYGYYTPLHSIYQTWIFEGGLLCALIVAGILIRHLLALLRVRRRARHPDDALLARCLLFSTMGMLLIGLFHQMHQGPLFYMVLGMALGLRRRVVDAGSRVVLAGGAR